MEDYIVSIKDLHKKFGNGRSAVSILNGVDLAIKRGSFLAITGNSGSGKTTLLNIIGFMDTYTSGSYIFDGVDTNTLSGSDRARIRGSKIGFVFQSYNLINTMTARENIELPLGYNGVGKSERRNRSDELLEYVGLSHRRDSLPSKMSGGEQQRVAIARAMVYKPQIILADEPTGNLDERNTGEIMEVFGNLNRGGTSIVMVTHNSGLVSLADEAVVVEEGRVNKIFN